LNLRRVAAFFVLYALAGTAPACQRPPPDKQEREWQACAATWSPLERRVFDGLSYGHESAIASLSHRNGGCVAGRLLLHSLAAYPPDRRDDAFDLLNGG